MDCSELRGTRIRPVLMCQDREIPVHEVWLSIARDEFAPSLCVRTTRYLYTKYGFQLREHELAPSLRVRTTRYLYTSLAIDVKGYGFQLREHELAPSLRVRTTRYLYTSLAIDVMVLKCKVRRPCPGFMCVKTMRYLHTSLAIGVTAPGNRLTPLRGAGD